MKKNCLLDLKVDFLFPTCFIGISWRKNMDDF